MTRTPPDGTRGDLKARTKIRQDALVTSLSRGVWPAAPRVPNLAMHVQMTPAAGLGEASGNSNADSFASMPQLVQLVQVTIASKEVDPWPASEARRR